jgi:hypothetical protein
MRGLHYGCRDHRCSTPRLAHHAWRMTDEPHLLQDRCGYGCPWHGSCIGQPPGRAQGTASPHNCTRSPAAGSLLGPPPSAARRPGRRWTATPASARAEPAPAQALPTSPGSAAVPPDPATGRAGTRHGTPAARLPGFLALRRPVGEAALLSWPVPDAGEEPGSRPPGRRTVSSDSHDCPLAPQRRVCGAVEAPSHTRRGFRHGIHGDVFVGCPVMCAADATVGCGAAPAHHLGITPGRVNLVRFARGRCQAPRPPG